jgi:hypothetical protein
MLARPVHEVLHLGLVPRERWLSLICRERAIGRRSVVQQRALLHSFTHHVAPPVRPPPVARTYTSPTVQVPHYNQSQLPLSALPRPSAPASHKRKRTRDTTHVVRYSQSALPFSAPRKRKRPPDTTQVVRSQLPLSALTRRAAPASHKRKRTRNTTEVVRSQLPLNALTRRSAPASRKRKHTRDTTPVVRYSQSALPFSPPIRPPTPP